MSVERQIGNCQICEGDFKIRDGQMVHHGYERPGIGEIVGDCPGVGHVPYEVSCDLVRVERENVRINLEKYRERLRALRAGEIDTLARTEYRPGEAREPRPRIGQVEIRPRFGDADTYWVTYSRELSAPSLWARLLDSAISRAKDDVERADYEVKRLTRRIDQWRPMPLRTVEEDEQRALAAKAERLGARLALKAEKDRKASEKEAEKERKAIEKMRKFSPEIAALKDHLRELAERHARASSNEEKVKIQVNAHDSVSRLVGYDTPLGATIKARFLRNLDMDTELVRLTILSTRRLRSGQIDYEESGNRWVATGE